MLLKKVREDHAMPLIVLMDRGSIGQRHALEKVIGRVAGIYTSKATSHSANFLCVRV